MSLMAGDLASEVLQEADVEQRYSLFGYNRPST